MCPRPEIRMFEHGMPCASEINSNGGSRRGHVELFPSATANLVSLLPQWLWPQTCQGDEVP